ncbi:hypothetical protein CYMTET_31938 [Cymbomonas tetramitiformis]|uniref:Uncharacterized protein n=1 Tax=Cymbomonas tetramitiformis TaxID=36881 RepID=A0AAE0FG05_9CHLO|nr:hypothetical protein CYMTET_31938 [Cymbomonas tetramitiformis]
MSMFAKLALRCAATAPCQQIAQSYACAAIGTFASRSLSTDTSGRLQGKVSIITGGASGIGREAALLFAREGSKIVVADLSEEGAAATAKEVQAMGGSAIAVKVDVAVEAEVAAVVAKAEDEYGAVHVMFNNAGIMMSSDDDAVNTSEEVIDKTLAVNVKGVLNGCKYSIPAMRRAGGGSIVNTASFVSFMGAATPQVAYTASKGAVLALTRELAVVHARENIRVNNLCPGPLRTELLMKFLDTEEKKHRRLVHVPMGRFGEAAEMAKGALFLASDDSSYMTGNNLLLDGGITAAYVTPE